MRRSKEAAERGLRESSRESSKEGGKKVRERELKGGGGATSTLSLLEQRELKESCPLKGEAEAMFSFVKNS